MNARTILGLSVVGLAACWGQSTASDAGPLPAAGADRPSASDATATAPTTTSGVAVEEAARAPVSGASIEPAGSGSPPWQPTPLGAPSETVAAQDAGVACAYPGYPPAEWSPEPWVPYESVDPAALLQAVQAALPGVWHGLARTPWTTPYRVELSFGADGSYSGRCSEVACCVAFYYGSDDDTPIKRYRIEDATLSGNVFGEIDIAFEYGAGEYGLPAWQGELSHIERDASGNGLRFQFQTDSGYGPVEYDLRRSAER